MAARLARFLRQNFPADEAPTAPAPPPEPRVRPMAPPAVLDVEGDGAVALGLRIAPSVARAGKADGAERGIDVPFSTDGDARAAQQQVKAAFAQEGWDDRVSVWLWRPSSGGQPATEAGRTAGRELRLAPKFV